MGVTDVLKIDIWSDIACPWCYIGKRRFEEGQRRYAATDGALPVEVEYHSFELAPDTPADFEGSEVDFLARHKRLPAQDVEQMLAHVTKIAADVGLAYDFDALRHANTRKAHQVLHLAKAQGRQLALAERLFAAYFEEGRHIGHDDDLAALAADAGLDPAEVLDALRDRTFTDDVDADIDQARAYGITGVPFFVVDGRYGISGAQDPALFAQALTQASEDRTKVEA